MKYGNNLDRCDQLWMVGTHHLPFTRLLKWANKYATSHPEKKLLFQIGTTPTIFTPEATSQPKNLQLIVSLTTTQMEQLKPQKVILPAGPSLMMEWIRRGYHPIIVPRKPEKNEHIDQHQILFAQEMCKTGMITVINEYQQLVTILEQTQNQELTADHNSTFIQKLPTIRETAHRFEKLANQILIPKKK